MAARGLRNSWEASATKRRSLVSEACLALRAPCTLPSIRLKAPVSCATSCSGGRAGSGTAGTSTSPRSRSSCETVDAVADNDRSGFVAALATARVANAAATTAATPRATASRLRRTMVVLTVSSGRANTISSWSRLYCATARYWPSSGMSTVCFWPSVLTFNRASMASAETLSYSPCPIFDATLTPLELRSTTMVPGGVPGARMPFGRPFCWPVSRVWRALALSTCLSNCSYMMTLAATMVPAEISSASTATTAVTRRRSWAERLAGRIRNSRVAARTRPRAWCGSSGSGPRRSSCAGRRCRARRRWPGRRSRSSTPDRGSGPC